MNERASIHGDGSQAGIPIPGHQTLPPAPVHHVVQAPVNAPTGRPKSFDDYWSATLTKVVVGILVVLLGGGKAIDFISSEKYESDRVISETKLDSKFDKLSTQLKAIQADVTDLAELPEIVRDHGQRLERHKQELEAIKTAREGQRQYVDVLENYTTVMKNWKARCEK